MTAPMYPPLESQPEGPSPHEQDEGFGDEEKLEQEPNNGSIDVDLSTLVSGGFTKYAGIARGEFDDTDPQEQVYAEILSPEGQNRISAVVRGVLGNGVDGATVEDTTQEVVIRAFRKAQQFRRDKNAKPSTWVHRIAANTAITEGKKWSRDRGSSAGSLDVEENGLAGTLYDQDPELDPERVTIARMALDDVISAMENLISEKSKEAILLRATGLEYFDIGRILGIEESAAKVRVHRARVVLGAWRAQKDTQNT